MVEPLQAALRAASSALEAQSTRIRVVSENVANAQTTGATPGSDPYRRKTISFGEELARAEGVRKVAIRAIDVDPSDFRMTLDPGHPAADERGYVKMPNVDPILEMADLREANRSYQANVQVVRQTRELFSLTIDLLKA